MEQEIIDIPEPILKSKIRYRRTRPPKRERARILLAHPLAIRREINNRSLYEFTKYMWPEVSADDFEDNWHVKYLCDELQKVGENAGNKNDKLYDIVINIPPGMTKTIIVNIMFPTWVWTRWYWMKFITAGYNETVALEPAEASRDLIKSDRFHMLYPELSIKQDKDTKTNFRVVKKVPGRGKGRRERILRGGNRFSTSVKGTATGFHAHIQIVDDPINPKEAVTEVGLRNANHFTDQTLSTRKTNKKRTFLILVMQRLHQDDPSGHMLRKKGKKIKHICLPGRISGDDNKYKKLVTPPELIENYTKEGLLDSKRLDPEALHELLVDLGQYGYAGQIGQNPTPPGGGMFKVDHFQVINFKINPVNIEWTIRYWDKAATDGGGAYTAGVQMSRLTNGKFIIWDVKRGQWGTDERERIIKETAEADGIETVVYVEQEPGSGGKDSANATIRNLAGFVAGKDLASGKGSKVYRADPYSVQVNEGNVLLMNGDWVSEFIDEHRFFPFSTYKDQVDAASGAFSKLTKKKEAGAAI